MTLLTIKLMTTVIGQLTANVKLAPTLCRHTAILVYSLHLVVCHRRAPSIRRRQNWMRQSGFCGQLVSVALLKYTQSVL